MTLAELWQCDGHPTVVLRKTPDGGPQVCKLPNGTRVWVLHKQLESSFVQTTMDLSVEGWVKTTNLRFFESIGVASKRLTDYFLTLHDIIGPRPTGNPLELMQAELEALRCPDCAGFIDKLNSEETDGIEETEIYGFDEAERAAYGILQRRDAANDGMLTVRAARKVGSLVAAALEARDKSSGLNSIIYIMYKMMFKLHSPLDKRVTHGYPNFSKTRHLKAETTQHVEFDFLTVDPWAMVPANAMVKFLPDNADAMHSPFYINDRTCLFPPLTSFFRLDTSDPWEPTFSLQLLSEHLTAPPEIWHAVKHDDVDALQSWLASNPTANLEHVHPKFGCCLLYSACKYGHISCVQLLVENCSDINSALSSKRSTPLHAAAFFDHPEVASSLLQHGASLEMKNAFGLTPIEEAADSVKPILDKAAAVAASPGDSLSPHKMMVDARQLQFGSRTDFLVGLRGMLGSVSTSMEWEFTGRHVEPWSDQFGSDYDSKEIWNRVVADAGGLTSHPTAIAAKLTQEDIVALRAYTSPAYWPLNKFLRSLGKAMMEEDTHATACLLAAERTWAATALALDVAMSKLLAVQKGFDPLVRGIKGTLPTEFFIPDERGMIIITEHGFMSTSRDPSTAESFAGDGTRPSILLKLECRRRDGFGYHTGVDLEWVSEVPSEQEVLFPPFTLINIIRKRREGLKVVLTGVPTFAAA